jgi:hypothetical protein
MKRLGYYAKKQSNRSSIPEYEWTQDDEFTVKDHVR